MRNLYVCSLRKENGDPWPNYYVIDTDVVTALQGVSNDFLMTREKIQAGYYSKGWARIWVIRFDSDILKVLLRYGPHRKRPYLKYGPDYIGTVYISVDKWDAIRNNTIRQFEEISKIQEEYISHVEIPQELREIVEKYYRENVKICKLC